MKSEHGQPDNRWMDTYFMSGGNDDFLSFWRSFLQSQTRHILFVMGLGFDPRMCSAIREVLSVGQGGKRDLVLLAFDEGPDSPSLRYKDMVIANRDRIEQLLKGRGTITEKQIEMWSTDGRRIGPRNATSVFGNLNQIAGYTDLIVDVSALPRSIYFPLIGRLLRLLDSGPTGSSLPNLHVTVSESADLDRLILAEGIDEDATYLHGFGGGVDMESSAETPRIWIPILGERQSAELERIYYLVQPSEICPVLPLACSNPRRGDNLLLEYREIMFDRFGVEPRNIIYASEKNPFDVYREVARTVRQYCEALEPLGGCKAVISAHSSKLLSVGALLAAYELGKVVGVAHVEARGYTIDDPAPDALDTTREELFEMWLAGECYGQ